MRDATSITAGMTASGDPEAMGGISQGGGIHAWHAERWTVIVPFFNERAHLPSCIASLARQDVPFRLVLVDNASTDGSGAVALAACAAAGVSAELLVEQEPGKVAALRTGWRRRAPNSSPRAMPIRCTRPTIFARRQLAGPGRGGRCRRHATARRFALATAVRGMETGTDVEAAAAAVPERRRGAGVPHVGAARPAASTRRSGTGCWKITRSWHGSSSKAASPITGTSNARSNGPAPAPRRVALSRTHPVPLLARGESQGVLPRIPCGQAARARPQQ
jgi:hypothetical protein